MTPDNLKQRALEQAYISAFDHLFSIYHASAALGEDPVESASRFGRGLRELETIYESVARVIKPL